MKTHGMSDAPEYLAWGRMLSRCRDPSRTRYHGRGITVCERWSSFENFYADIGPMPGLGYSVERDDNNGNYEPTNCRWAIHKEQCNNRSSNRIVEYRGSKMTFTMAVEFVGVVCMSTAHRRVSCGWSLERAIETPPGPQRNKRYVKEAIRP